MKRALILGIGGQDGSYLADILLEKGYEVHGLIRHSSTGNIHRIDHIRDRITLHRGDMADPLSIHRILRDVCPQEIYNEADQDNVGWSYDAVCYSADITYGAVARTLQSVIDIRDNSYRRERGEVKFFQPVSATMFGNSPPPQSETTPFDPQSPYAVAKTAAYYAARYYRETHGLFVSTGILFNHDSPRRTEDYLLNKICRSAIRIEDGKQETLELSNLDLKVDIGYAREYMEAAHSMLQLDEPDDFVIGTGMGFTIHDLALCALDALEERENQLRGKKVMGDNQPTLLAGARKAQEKFGFDPIYYGFELIEFMMKEMREEAKR